MKLRDIAMTVLSITKTDGAPPDSPTAIQEFDGGLACSPNADDQTRRNPEGTLTARQPDIAGAPQSIPR
jgi:hypothetical protein